MSISELAIRLSGWPRRIAAVICLVIAGASAVAAHDDRVPATGPPVVVATRDLAAGTRLAGGDLQVKAWPERVRPPDALGRTTQAVGQRLAGPIRAGEPLTSTRLVGADLTAGLPPTMRALPVEITGSASLSLVHAGDSIDLVVGDPPEAETGPSRSARVLAESVRVLAVARQTTDPGGDLETLGLIVAAEPATALKIASAAGRPIVATVRKPP